MKKKAQWKRNPNEFCELYRYIHTYIHLQYTTCALPINPSPPRSSSLRFVIHEWRQNCATRRIFCLVRSWSSFFFFFFASINTLLPFNEIRVSNFFLRFLLITNVFNILISSRPNVTMIRITSHYLSFDDLSKFNQTCLKSLQSDPVFFLTFIKVMNLWHFFFLYLLLFVRIFIL